MRKYFQFLFVALFAAMTVVLPSCSKDDPESGNIVGTWECVETFVDDIDWGDLWEDSGMDNPYDNVKNYVRFSADGEYTEVTDDDGDVDVSTGTWTRSGDKITIKGHGMPTTTATIVELKNKKMTLEVMGLTNSYKKVSDSTLDKYLE